MESLDQQAKEVTMSTQQYRPLTDEDRRHAASAAGFLFITSLFALIQTAFVSRWLVPTPSFWEHLPFVYFLSDYPGTQANPLLRGCVTISSWLACTYMFAAFCAVGRANTHSHVAFRSGNTTYFREEAGRKGNPLVLVLFLPATAGMSLGFLAVLAAASEAPMALLYGLGGVVIPLLLAVPVHRLGQVAIRRLAPR